MPGPDLNFINQSMARELGNSGDTAQLDPNHPQHRGNQLLRTLMMLLQGADSINTANFLKRPGTFETDPLMKPFAQPGNPMPMMGAYAAEDSMIPRMAGGSAGKENLMNILQILLNLGGLAKTERSKKHG